MYFFILLLTVASENHFWILIDCEINLMGDIKIIYNQMASREISVLFSRRRFSVSDFFCETRLFCNLKNVSISETLAD